MKSTGPDIMEDVTMITPREPWAWVLPTAIALVVCLIIAVVVWRLFRAKKLPFQHPATPPEVVARERLAALRRLIEEGLDAQFVIEISDILRVYTEARFGLKAPRLSSEEFLFEAERSALIDERWRQSLGDFLLQCDRVKFALAHLKAERMEVLYATTETYINDTAARPLPTPAPSVAEPSVA